MGYLRNLIVLLFITSCLVFNYLILLLKYEDLFVSFAKKHIGYTTNVYDYIVVGAGSAGSVIAHRLGKDLNSTVLILEAGPYIGSLIDIPVITPLLHQSILNWQHETVPQRHACFGLVNNQSRWTMGKVTGGTHRLNNMIYTIGHPADYAEWFKDLSSYDYEADVFSYHKKAVGFYEDGPIHLSDITYTTVSNYVLNASKQLGFQEADLNIHPYTGFAKPKLTAKRGRRFTTFHFMYANKKPNVKLETNSHVIKILFKSNFEAYAVLYKSLGRYYKVRARKAIVLSAGVIGTPKILMLSGIGDAKHLEDVKIDCFNNLPVGNNLQDHVTTGLDLITLKSPVNFQIGHILSPSAALRYYFDSSGAWTSSGCEAIGIINGTTNEVPELELMLIPTGIAADDGSFLRESMGVNDRTWDSYFANTIRNNTITILPVVLHPKSRGTVRLKDNNPFGRPMIDPNYLSDPNDVDVLLKGIRLIKELIETEPMKSIGASLNRNKVDGCAAYRFDTKEYWECYVRHLTVTAYHPIGTCKMGNDETSVVDYDHRVINTNKLYTADASSIPSLTSANINAAVIMLAERAADIIKYHDYLVANTCRKMEIFVKVQRC